METRSMVVPVAVGDDPIPPQAAGSDDHDALPACCHSSSRAVEDYVFAHRGKHIITRILIANNGNAAIKALRSLRQWALSVFGDPKVLEFVVMATPDDIEANAEYISEGDYLAEVPAGPTNNNYANINLIVQIAEEYDCDAVWPGWGHASEDYKLPLSLAASSRKTIWMGPSASSMLALGDKIGSTLIAQSVGVPCVPWSGSHVRCHVSDFNTAAGLKLSDETLELAAVHTPEECLRACEVTGFPAMLKASAGGGGKGIRKVYRADDVETAFRQVTSEVKNSLVFVMKLVERCRHLEVQVISDNYGNVRSLGARDCTVQRRCQKLIEESPVVAAPAHVVEEMERAAVSLCAVVHYTSVATCEFIYDLDKECVYFLEVNARLQVEHVVTEVVNDINLVAAQLQIAMGIPLNQIPDIVRCLDSRPRDIHCIAGRVTAEHAEESFRPTCGQVFELHFRPSMHVWGYFSIGASGRVHAYADSQIGHLFAWGRDREEARNHLIMGLRGLTIRGEIRTNIEALLKLLQLPDFIMSATTTTWVENSVNFQTPSLCAQTLSMAGNISSECTQELRGVLFAAAYEAFLAFKQNEKEFLGKIGQGQFPPLLRVTHSTCLVYKHLRFDLDCYFTGRWRVMYHLKHPGCSSTQIVVELNKSRCEVFLRSISSTETVPESSCGEKASEEASTACFLISGGLDGRSRRVLYKIDSTGIQVTFDGATFTFTKETDPTQVRAPVSGKLSRWLVPSGASVQRGQTYAEIEIMKMYMQLQVAETGILSHALAEGAVFKTGDLLATLELPEAFVTHKIEPFQGVFPAPDLRKTQRDHRPLSSTTGSSNALRVYREARDKLYGALDGYYCSETEARAAMADLMQRIFNPEIPRMEIREALSVMESTLPTVLVTQLYRLLDGTAIVGSPRTGSANRNGDRTNRKSLVTHNLEEQDSLHFENAVSVSQSAVSFMTGITGGGGGGGGCGGNDLGDPRGLGLRPSVELQNDLLPIRQMFDAIDDYLVYQVNAPDCPKLTRAQLEPLTDLLLRHEGGPLVTAVETIVSLLTHYLEVEEIFDQFDGEAAAKVILAKRTELDAAQLAVVARSHQALSQRNQLINLILSYIRHTPSFMDELRFFHEPLQRLSNLTKVDYSPVSLRARQLLLSRRQKPFVERTLALMESLGDYIERRQPSGGGYGQSGQISSYSPNAAGPRVALLGSSTTPVTAGGPPSVLLFSGYSASGGKQLLGAFGGLGLTPSSLIQSFVGDIDEAADDSLIALLAHPLRSFRKVALEIHVRRHLERWGLHDLRICCDGDSWVSPFTLSPGGGDTMQREAQVTVGERMGVLTTTATTTSWNQGPATAPQISSNQTTLRSGYNMNRPAGTPATCSWGGPSRGTGGPLDHDGRLLTGSGQAMPSLRAFTEATAETPTWRLFSVPSVSTPASQPAPSQRKLLEMAAAAETWNFPSASEVSFRQPAAEPNIRVPLTLPPGAVPNCWRADSDETTSIGVQRVNRLLAVWVCSAVLSYDFLTRTCDVITEGRNPIYQSKGVHPTHMESSSLAAERTTETSRPESKAVMSLLEERSATTAETSRGLGGPRASAVSSAQLGNLGLDCDSRLHHMLNAFSGVGGDLNGRPTGRSQLMVAMAFQSLDHFRAAFDSCLDEYSVLQAFMPAPPPTTDGKVLLVFISDLQDAYSKTSDYHQDVGTSTSYACLEQECQRRGERFAELNFNIVGFSFLLGRTSGDLKFESTCYGTRSHRDTRTTSHSWEYIGVPFPCSGGEERKGPGGSKRSPPGNDKEPGLDIGGENKGSMKVQPSGFLAGDVSDGGHPASWSSATALAISSDARGTPSLPPPTSQSVPVVDGSSTYPASSVLRPGPQQEATRGSGLSETWRGGSGSQSDAGFRLLEERVSDFDLISPSVPRYMYFRNLIALPPASSLADIGWLADPCVPSAEAGPLSSGDLLPDTASAAFTEEPLLRNVVCSQFVNLELQRFIHFNVKAIPTSAPHIRVFDATPKPLPGQKEGAGASRLFVRILVQFKLNTDEDEGWAELERHFVAGLNALELAQKARGNHGSRPSPSHHVLLTVGLQSPSLQTACPKGQDLTQRVSPAAVEGVALTLAKRYALRLTNQRIGTVEIRFSQRSLSASDTFVPIRIVITNPTQQSLRVQKFVEISDPTTGELIYSALDASDSLAVSVRQPGSFNAATTASGQQQISCVPRSAVTTQRDVTYDGMSVNTPHPLTGPLDEKRALAVSLSTIYVYDFLELFEEAIKKHWRSCPKYFVPGFPEHSTLREAVSQDTLQAPASAARSLRPPNTFLPDRVLESVELVLDSCGEVQETVREPGQNTCGMVAWRVLMRTPEFPRGRRVILIGNDVTYQMGTFGVQEDLLFQRVSEVARKEGIPRIYIAVNSGARMGLATEVQRCLRVEWVNPDQPSLGFKYLYVTEDDYRRLKDLDAITAEPTVHPTERRVYKLTTVIGAQVGLGVENLCGSGAIAGETSRAYDSNVTITLVTGRTVGIGAYITRLGQRVIQKASSAPILLTGYQALNRLIGRDVYGSNDEIGGVDVMARNGVTHLTVADDIQGCEEIIRWLSYIPEHREGALPIMVDPTDPLTRPVSYRVTSVTEDPRLMLTGCIDAKGRWLGGLFDRSSFKEVLGDWAKSVIVGRARLGGIPVGVIAVETRVTETLLPADPAMVTSAETKLLRAGQVWFPDSAYKTAQAIADFDREEIPLMILANWRGFSGGQRDMFFEVLKFGSFIVDSLTKFKQPCIVYIPPKGELRGGAWVVVDPRINSSFMSMFAAPDSRGGVLEPTATVEIKFRTKALAEVAERLDPVLKTLAQEDRSLATDGVPVDDPRRQEVKERRDRRLQELLPVYKQVATHFADLHDTATRMKRTAAISEIVPWERSRHFFYWQLRKQLILFNLRLEIVKANPSLTIAAAEQLVYRWAAESGHVFQSALPNSLTTSININAQFVNWACHSLVDISRRLAALRREFLQDQVISMCKQSPGLIQEVVKKLAPNPDPVLLAALFGSVIDESGRSSGGAVGPSSAGVA